MARKPDVQYVRFVTDGSAARALEAPAHKPKTKLPKVRKAGMLVLKVDPLAFTGVVLSLVMAVLMIVNCVQLKENQESADAMYGYVEQLRQENCNLTKTYRNGYDLDDVREKALALGMIPKSEAKRITVDAPPVQSEQETPERDLLTVLFD
jgi:hypothetical protein